MLCKYWFEPVKRLYIKKYPVVRVLSSRVRAMVVWAWGVFLHLIFREFAGTDEQVLAIHGVRDSVSSSDQSLTVL